MAIFRYEWRKLRGYTIGWALSVGLLIFAMLPVYYQMVGMGGGTLGAMADFGIFELLGVDARTITQPVGVYGFLTAFFSLAGGICGMYLGLGTFTKETVSNTAEFTYTKPFRRGAVYTAKVLASALSALIIALSFYLGSVLAVVTGLPAGVDRGLFTLVGLSFLWVELFFLLLGALVGTVHPKIRTPMLFSSGVAFVFYVFSAFASKVNASAIKYLTPYSWFGASRIITLGRYDWGYLAACATLCAAFAVAGLATFVKKDVTLVS